MPTQADASQTKAKQQCISKASHIIILPKHNFFLRSVARNKGPSFTRTGTRFSNNEKGYTVQKYCRYCIFPLLRFCTEPTVVRAPASSSAIRCSGTVMQFCYYIDQQRSKCTNQFHPTRIPTFHRARNMSAKSNVLLVASKTVM